MQPLNYLNTTVGLIWTIACVPLGIIITVLSYMIINKIPAKWLCDYDEEPSEELISGKRIIFFPTGIIATVLTTAALVLCRLGFNKGFDIYFCIETLIIFACLLIAISDAKYQIIPDQFTIALGILAVGLSVYDIARGFKILHSTWWSPLAGAALGGALMLLVGYIGKIAYKRDGIGFGDVKLFAAVGVLTGFPGTIYLFIIAVITAAVFFVVILIARRVKGSSQTAEVTTEEKLDDNIENTEKEEGKETDPEIIPDEEKNEKSVYLAFGPYIVASVAVYIALFDLIHYLVGLYLNLF